MLSRICRGWRHSDYRVGLGRGVLDVHTSARREVTPPRDASVPSSADDSCAVAQPSDTRYRPADTCRAAGHGVHLRPSETHSPRGDSGSLEEHQVLSPRRFLRGTYVHIRAELDEKALPLEAQLPHLCPVEGVDLRKTLRREASAGEPGTARSATRELVCFAPGDQKGRLM